MTEEIKEAKTEENTVEKTDKTSPKWAIELGAKIDKLADALLRSVDTKQDVPSPEDVTPAKPTPEEECTANGGEWVDGACKMPEKPAETKAEEKVTETVYKEEDVKKMIEEEVKKALATPSVKKSIVPKTVEETFPAYAKIAKMSWNELEATAQKFGAPTRRR